MENILTFTTWKGNTLGFKVSKRDRDLYFSHEWEFVIVELPCSNGYGKAVCNINKKSFWNDTCHELIEKEVTDWLKENGYDTWKYRHPYKFEVQYMNENIFRLLKRI